MNGSIAGGTKRKRTGLARSLKKWYVDEKVLEEKPNSEETFFRWEKEGEESKLES